LKRTRGKFNANSRNPLAWAELLKGINPADGYESITFYVPGSDDEFVLPAVTGDSSHSRAAIAEALAIGSNDREQEALIGRTANLLTTRMDKYTARAIGQLLKKIDLPEGFKMTDEFKRTLVNPIPINEDWYSILATQHILAHIVRDAWRNKYEIVQLQLLED